MIVANVLTILVILGVLLMAVALVINWDKTFVWATIATVFFLSLLAIMLMVSLGMRIAEAVT